MPALGRLRQEDDEFGSSLGPIMRLDLKKKQQKGPVLSTLKPPEVGMVVSTCNPSTWQAKAGAHGNLEASLI